MTTQTGPGYAPRLSWMNEWRATWTLNHGPLPYQESSRVFDLRLLELEQPSPSVNVHRRPLVVAAIVTQLVTQARRVAACAHGSGAGRPTTALAGLVADQLATWSVPGPQANDRLLSRSLHCCARPIAWANAMTWACGSALAPFIPPDLSQPTARYSFSLCTFMLT